MRVEAKLVELKESQELWRRDLNAGIETKRQAVKLKVSVAPQPITASILETVETIINARIKAEVETLRAATFVTKPTTGCGCVCNEKAGSNNNVLPREAV
ncbi:hypothetical protein P3T76_016191 [Phytophthora citrophthora]|uniref:Uncharacterized protein n=1 Tax=Phytophthora citrophthora TaxID=4793 RepID=A0AAD9FXZ9_9STRA|nr:hypothetical protein P3T76_016191 [Phytophthora citrophthora]